MSETTERLSRALGGIPLLLDRLGEDGAGNAVNEAIVDLSRLRKEVQELKRREKKLLRGIVNDGNDFDMAFMEAYLDNFKTLRSAVERLAAERDEARESLSILTDAYDGHELGGDTWSRTKKLLGRKEADDGQAR